MIFRVLICSMLVNTYVFLCYLFFFTLKSAYEMLISDWSSDVCSSDLRTVQVDIGARRMLVVHQLARILLDVDAFDAYLLGRGVGIQIGRASCRERVCQYV